MSVSLRRRTEASRAAHDIEDDIDASETLANIIGHRCAALGLWYYLLNRGQAVIAPGAHPL